MDAMEYPHFNRKYIFNPGPFSIAILDYRSVNFKIKHVFLNSWATQQAAYFEGFLETLVGAVTDSPVTVMSNEWTKNYRNIWDKDPFLPFSV